MVIFYCYVSSPEGTWFEESARFTVPHFIRSSTPRLFLLSVQSWVCRALGWRVKIIGAVWFRSFGAKRWYINQINIYITFNRWYILYFIYIHHITHSNKYNISYFTSREEGNDPHGKHWTPGPWPWKSRVSEHDLTEQMRPKPLGQLPPPWIEDGNICENKRYLYQEILCRTWTWYAKRRRGLKRLKSIANLLNHICLKIYPPGSARPPHADVFFVRTFMRTYININPEIHRHTYHIHIRLRTCICIHP